MNHNVRQGVQGPLARIRPARRRFRRRVQPRPGPADQLAGHPGAFLTRGNERRRRAGFPIRVPGPLAHEPAASLPGPRRGRLAWISRLASPADRLSQLARW